MKSLCDYCKYQPSCSLTTTKKEIYDCSEYAGTLIFTDISQSANIQHSYSHTETSSGLCKDCDFENSCSLNEFGTVVFNCEQYQ